jgi:hypothetical protein
MACPGSKAIVPSDSHHSLQPEALGGRWAERSSSGCRASAGLCKLLGTHCPAQFHAHLAEGHPWKKLPLEFSTDCGLAVSIGKRGPGVSGPSLVAGPDQLAERRSWGTGAKSNQNHQLLPAGFWSPSFFGIYVWEWIVLLYCYNLLFFTFNFDINFFFFFGLEPQSS